MHPKAGLFERRRGLVCLQSMAAVLSNDGSTHKSRRHAHFSKIPIHSTRKKTKISAAVGKSPTKIPSIKISSTVPIIPVSSTITISSSSPDYIESWPSREQATPPAPVRSLFHDEKQSESKEDIDTTLSLSLSTSSLQSSPPCPQSNMQQKHWTLTERTQQLIDSSTALIQSPAPNISLHHKDHSTPPPPPSSCVEEGDILQQWRLRRRLEEARCQATAPSISYLDKRVNVVPYSSVPEGDVTTLHETYPSRIIQQETSMENCSQSQNTHFLHDHHHKSHTPHDHHHKSHISHDHHHKSHTSHDHHHKSHNAHTTHDHPHNVELCRHISEQNSIRSKKRSAHKKPRERGKLQEQLMQQKEMPIKDEKKRQLKSSSWKEECVRYPLSLSGSDDDTSWDTDSLITDNTSPPPHSSSPAEDVSLTQLLAETVQQHLYGTPPPASPGVPSHIYPCATPCPEVDNHPKDELLAELLKRALSLSKTISEVDQCLAAMDTMDTA